MLIFLNFDTSGRGRVLGHSDDMWRLTVSRAVRMLKQASNQFEYAAILS